jgi:hypothetical protein
MLEHWGTAEACQSLYLQVHKIVAIQLKCIRYTLHILSGSLVT